MLFAVEACVFRPGDLGGQCEFVGLFGGRPINIEERRNVRGDLPTTLGEPYQGSGSSGAGAANAFPGLENERGRYSRGGLGSRATCRGRRQRPCGPMRTRAARPLSYSCGGRERCLRRLAASSSRTTRSSFSASIGLVMKSVPPALKLLTATGIVLCRVTKRIGMSAR